MPADLAALLWDRGHDVTDVIDEGLGGEDDSPVLKAAVDEDRILFTFDLDFADIRAYPPGSHAGIVVFRLKDQRFKTLKDSVEKLLAKGLGTLGSGLAIVDESRVPWKRPKD